MAIQFNLPDISKILRPDETGVPDFISALKKGMELGYMPRNQENAAFGQELANRIKTPYAQNAERAFEADVGGQEANAGLSRENMLKQRILNEFLRQREPAEIEEIRQRAKYYGSGGAGGSTGGKDYLAYASGVAQDNPDLTPEQLREATDVLAKGGTSLRDGTPLQPMSFGTRTAFDRAVKATTTAGQINTSNMANQAHAELDVFNKYANDWIPAAGTLYFGKSLDQIADTFKDDDASQKRLAKIIAGNTLQYEIAQQRNRISLGQPGITATRELMDEAKQHVNTVLPRLTPKARKYVNEYLDKAIKEGLSARNKVGVGAGNTYQAKFANSVGAQPVGQPSPNTEVPAGTVILYKNGKDYFIPQDKVDEALSEGFQYGQ